MVAKKKVKMSMNTGGDISLKTIMMFAQFVQKE
mgnify:FL=1